MIKKQFNSLNDMHLSGFLIVIIASFLCITINQVNAASCTTSNIITTKGSVCGTSNANSTTAYAYLGIPYAESTTGTNRWVAPVEKQAWSGVYEATAFGASCPQPTTKLTTSEDCLSLNVWTPVGPGSSLSLPVMVFIYGGAFISGASSLPVYNGAYLASKQNIVIVTINYRVGAFGFLNYGSTLNGNFGILDQQAALKWVQDNIAQFGGDPNQVTIFGESAGAMSVGIHLTAAPDSSSLFRAGIMESNPFGIPYKSPTQAKAFGKNLAKQLGCDNTTEDSTISCMRSATTSQVLTASLSTATLVKPIISNGLIDILPWAPVIDGTVIEQEPIVAIEQGNLTKTVIMGVNKDEGILFSVMMMNLLKNKLGQDNMTCLEYKVFVEDMFSISNAANILKQSRYGCSSGSITTQLSDLINDYIFLCGNHYAAKQAVANNNNNLFAYGFEVIPSFNLESSVSDCASKSCHGAELPFVFNSATNTGHTFTTTEQSIADMMGAYWANFATTNPTSSSSLQTWPAFSNSSSVFLFNTTSSGPTQNVSYSVCTDFWDTIGYNLGGTSN